MKNNIIFLLIGLLISNTVVAQRPYITVWKTDNPGVSGSNQIRLQTVGNYTYSWQAVSPTPPASGGGTGSLTITFPTPGIYRLYITPSGPFRHVFPIGGPTVADAKKLLKVEQWGDVAWSSMDLAFATCSFMTIEAADVPNLSNATSMRYMFYQASSFNQPVEKWNTSTITNMESVFEGASSFNQPIENWNTSNVTTMRSMFSGAFNFNQRIGNWNTGNVTDISGMFRNAYQFNQAIDTWNTGKVTNMSYMFYNSNFNQYIGSWNTGQVADMSHMFEYANYFNQDIGKWNTANVTNLSDMFSNAYVFNQDIGSWNTGNVTDMSDMFLTAIRFNQYIGGWNTEKVTNVMNMFSEASSFNQNLGSWNMTQLTTGGAMFYNSGMDCNNYSKTLIAWASNPATPGQVSFSRQGVKYGPSAQASRNTLINKGWTITGDTYDPDCIMIPDPRITTTDGCCLINGFGTTQSFLVPIQPTHYVRRLYQITPTNNPSISTAKITLYFSNQDFKDFNSQSTVPALLLPDADDPATIDARKANLLVEKIGGSSSDGSGLPGSYPGPSITINPNETDIRWNSTGSYWEVSFDVTGFSGFFVKTSIAALPAHFGDMAATFKNNQLHISWTTLSENNNSHFEVEASKDGKTFSRIGSINSKTTNGYSDKPTGYQLVFVTSEVGLMLGLSMAVLSCCLTYYKRRRKLLMVFICTSLCTLTILSCSKTDFADKDSAALFIRIKQVDKDGTSVYSKIIKARMD